MTQLIVSPKKVFRNIYYHVSHGSYHWTRNALLIFLPETCVSIDPPVYLPVGTLTRYRNQKLLPPRRPSLHLPHVPLPLHDRPSLGPRLRRRHRPNPAHSLRLRPRPLPRRLPAHSDRHVLPRRPRARQAKTRPLRTIGCWRGRIGVRVLL